MGWVRRAELDAANASADRIMELLLRAEGRLSRNESRMAQAVERAEFAEAESARLAARVRQLFAAQDVVSGVASSLAAAVAAVDAEQATA